MAYLVDTNIIVDVTRGSMTAADYLDSLAGAWSISVITCLELLAGARTQRETIDLDLVLGGYRAIPPNEELRALARATKNRKHFQMIGDLKLEVPNY